MRFGSIACGMSVSWWTTASGRAPTTARSMPSASKTSPIDRLDAQLAQRTGPLLAAGQARHLVAGGEQLRHEHPPDRSRGPCYENPHGSLLHHEVDELARDDHGLDDLLAVEMGLHLLGRAREAPRARPSARRPDAPTRSRSLPLTWTTSSTSSALSSAGSASGHGLLPDALARHQLVDLGAEVRREREDQRAGRRDGEAQLRLAVGAIRTASPCRGRRR